MAPDPMLKGACPYCFKKFGLKELAALKFKKKCKCNHCGKIIDERFKIY